MVISSGIFPQLHHLGLILYTNTGNIEHTEGIVPLDGCLGGVSIKAVDVPPWSAHICCLQSSFFSSSLFARREGVGLVLNIDR